MIRQTNKIVFPRFPKKAIAEITDISGLQAALANTTPHAVQRTGTAIAFDAPATYGTVSTPETANITGNYTNAKLGTIQLLVHNHSAAPTIPSSWLRHSLSSNYKLNAYNYIWMEWLQDDVVVYTIAQNL